MKSICSVLVLIFFHSTSNASCPEEGEKFGVLYPSSLAKLEANVEGYELIELDVDGYSVPLLKSMNVNKIIINNELLRKEGFFITITGNNFGLLFKEESTKRKLIKSSLYEDFVYSIENYNKSICKDGKWRDYDDTKLNLNKIIPISSSSRYLLMKNSIALFDDKGNGFLIYPGKAAESVIVVYMNIAKGIRDAYLSSIVRSK